MRDLNPDQIDALLPQTQCGLCGYGGCMPYAEAICYENAAINLCPPGGVETLAELGKMTATDHTPFIAEMQANTKPPLLAIIREAECIGCTKCIQACPVDAILGAAKQMHTIIAKDCTGCELCIAPCPVDCIDMIENPAPWTDQDKSLARDHFTKRKVRLDKIEREKNIKKQAASLQVKRNYIQAALDRAKAKKQKIKDS